MPVILLPGTLTGAVNGVIASRLINNLKKTAKKIQNGD
jgi:hypothetical protein